MRPDPRPVAAVVFFWFAGVSVVAVWLVFRSPALDYRMVMLGAVVPVGEIVLGGPRLLHALVSSVAVLTIVMLATRERRLLRRRWIGLAIGLLMHLVLDGIWTDTAAFWWPFFGWGFGSGELPELDRGVVAVASLELLGAGALAWVWVAFDLRDPANRERFVRTGQLPREERC